ncbi:conserved hypothetical protein [Psychromonas ingrahamii 37]|uniref:Uncharacterized protein n=2 Tax=Psychromonas ingrahamii TaxID=357794 RepID=A1SZ35_PSYIN|nr:conserved hypothetical protein [Psychromonas ingrahamii 37]
MSITIMNNETPWWGEVNLDKERCLQLDIGPLSVAIEHDAHEWRIHSQREKEVDTNDNRLHKIVGQFSPCYYQDVARYIVNSSSNHIQLLPALADRSVVCRPVAPINLDAGASVTLYVSTPIYLMINVVNSKTSLLQELATQRLSDTWFGPSTCSGELCYASATSGRLDLQKLPYRIQRATTPLLIHNNADDNLLFERVALPTPLLSLYAAKNGQLWTENITLTREDNGDFAQLKLGKAPLKMSFVNGPRKNIGHSQIIRAFSAIFN